VGVQGQLNHRELWHTASLSFRVSRCK
jgi:hypothetical protein